MIPKHLPLSALFLSLTMMFLCAPALAQIDILPAETGEVVGWVQEAEGSAGLVEPSGNVRPAAVQAEVMASDTLTTGADGRLQVIFKDKTMIALGGDSRLLVKDVMDLDGGGQYDLEFIQGVARVVTSEVVSANPDKFEMGTPLGTIGIRGTEFGSLVAAGREAHLLYEGGPVLFSDEQILSTDAAELMREACEKLGSARYLTEKVLYSLSSTQMRLKREMKDQLDEIIQLQEKYRCGLQ